MRIEVTEETGIRHEGLGHMQKGEIRVVPNDLGLFFCSNGWAKDVDGETPTGVRGGIDYEDPTTWAKGQREAAEKVVQPRDGKHRKGS